MGAWETVTAWVAVNLTVLAFLPRAQAQPSAARKQASYTHNVGIDNQSEIGTRAPPFAGYIEAMHRQIHRFWGDSCPAAPERPVRAERSRNP